MKRLLLIILLGFQTSTSIAIESNKSVILVHGAFADGSVWNKVIPILESKGLEVIAVQNPLTSLEEDTAFTLRAIEEARGEVILVGHSWGGMVISAAGNHEKVKSLVYVAAIAPQKNESIEQIFHEHYQLKQIPPAVGFTNPLIDQYGYLRLSQETFIKHFAPDIPKAEAKLLAATQGRFHKETLTQSTPKVAWENKPSWFIISKQDEMIAPNVLRAMAQKIDATTIELNTSHAPMLSKPDDVADVILKAASR